MIAINKKTVTSKKGEVFFCVEVAWMGGGKLVFIPKDVFDSIESIEVNQA